MIARTLVTLLTFQVNGSGLNQYNNMIGGIGSQARIVSRVIDTAIGGVLLNGIRAVGRGISDMITGIVTAGDEMTGVMNRLTSASGGNAEAATAAMERLYQTGKMTGLSLEDGAGQFTRFMVAARQLNRPAEDVLNLVEGIQMAGAIAGTSVHHMQIVSTQLGQALASGRFGGDEFRSFAENMPVLAERMAKAMGISIGELRKRSKEGKLDAKATFEGLLAATSGVQTEFARLTPTVDRSMAILNVVWRRYSADLDKALGLSTGIAKAIRYIYNQIDALRGGLTTVRDFVKGMGGIEDIAGLVGVALATAIGWPLVRMLVMSTSTVVGMSAALAVMAARAALTGVAFASWVLILEDILGWFNGKESMTGRLLGTPEELRKNIETAFGPLGEEFDKLFANQKNENLRNFVMIMREVRDTLLSIRDAAIGLKLFIQGDFQGAGTIFQSVMAQIQQSTTATVTSVLVLLATLNVALGAFRAFRVASAALGFGGAAAAAAPPVAAAAGGGAVAAGGARLGLARFGPVGAFLAGMWPSSTAADDTVSAHPELVPGYRPSQDIDRDGGNGAEDFERSYQLRMQRAGRMGTGEQSLAADIRAALGRMPGAAAAPAPRRVDATQNNTFNNTVNVTANGNVPGDVAAQAQKGVEWGVQGVLRAAGAFARDLSVANTGGEVTP